MRIAFEDEDMQNMDAKLSKAGIGPDGKLCGVKYRRKLGP